MTTHTDKARMLVKSLFSDEDVTYFTSKLFESDVNEVAQALRETELSTIERCAKVADRFPCYQILERQRKFAKGQRLRIAKAIRNQTSEGRA